MKICRPLLSSRLVFLVFLSCLSFFPSSRLPLFPLREWRARAGAHVDGLVRSVWQRRVDRARTAHRHAEVQEVLVGLVGVRARADLAVVDDRARFAVLANGEARAPGLPREAPEVPPRAVEILLHAGEVAR